MKLTRNQKIGGGAAVVVAMATPVVMHFEGKRNDPYWDVVRVRTVCYGETHGVQERRYSDEECKAMLEASLHKFHGEVSRCITRPVELHVQAAILSWAYNVGPGAACRSTLMRKLNAGDIAGACAELSRWVVAGGQRMAGLERRRADERRMCEGRPPALGGKG